MLPKVKCAKSASISSSTSSQASNLPSFRRKAATLLLARGNMEPGHLLYSALPCPSSGNALRLKSRHPFVSSVQQLISSSDNINIRAARWADHRWNAEWLHNPTRLRTFIPVTGTQPPGKTLPRTVWVLLNRLRTGVGSFRSCLHKWSIALLRPVSVTQKNNRSTTLSSNVQSINLHMDCIAWRYWMIRQLNGCSTLVPSSCAAKEWNERTVSKDDENKIFILVHLLAISILTVQCTSALCLSAV